MIGIYKITSPNGKIYIGQSRDINIRWKYSYFNITCKNQVKLYNSLKKHGYENHKFEVIEECIFEKLNERETFWKQYYLEQFNNDWSKVLFCGLYDTGGGSKSTETRQKMSFSQKGRKHSEETKKKIGQKNLGRKYSEADKIKISKAKKGIKFTEDKKKNMKGKRCKPILQYDLQGNFIEEWSSFKDIKDSLGFNNSGLCFCCKGIQKTAYKFIWKYKQ